MLRNAIWFDWAGCPRAARSRIAFSNSTCQLFQPDGNLQVFGRMRGAREYAVGKFTPVSDLLVSYATSPSWQLANYIGC